MTTSTLHRYLLDRPKVGSANILSKQFNVPVTTVTRTLRAHGYQFTGTDWNLCETKGGSNLSVSQDTLNRIEQAKGKRTTKEQIAAINIELEDGAYLNAMRLVLAVYLSFPENKLPLEL